MPADDNAKSNLSKNEIYKTLQAHVAAAESVSWNRFNNFLLFNSIIILAWVSLYSESCLPYRDLLLIAMSGGGIVSGLLWARLGLRARFAVDRIMKMGVCMEDDWDGNPNFRPFTKQKTCLPFSKSSSIYILSLGPLVLSLFHSLLLGLSIPEEVAIPSIHEDLVTWVLWAVALFLFLHFATKINNRIKKEKEREKERERQDC